MRAGMLKARGYTLIEMIIVTVVIGIMAAVLSPLMVSSLTANERTQGDVVVLDKLRYATERLAREIREVQYASSITTPPTNCAESTPTTDRYCFNAMGANGLTFRRSYTSSLGVVTWRTVTIGTTATASASCVAPPCVTLAYSGLSPDPGAQVLTDELYQTANLAFAYYRNDGTTLTNLADDVNCVTTSPSTCVSYVQISLTLRHNGNDYSQRTRIGLRNPPT